MKRFLVWLPVVLVFMFAGLTAQAQEGGQQKLRFAPGGSQASLNGSIFGRQSIDYVVGARRGQTISIRFAPNNRFAFFNLLAPQTGEALYVGEAQGNPRGFSMRLGATGEYVIRVYLARVAARRGESADYQMSVAVSGGAASSEPSVGVEDDGGPDYYVVSGLSPTDSLNMRRGPSTTEPVITTFRNGKILKNLGCRRAGAQRWCRVQNPLGAASGWVNGRFLRESSGPDAVAAPVQPEPPVDDAQAEEDGGPDFWVVTGLSAGDSLYMREGPSTAEPVITAFRNGKVLKNLGCRRLGERRWCRVENPVAGGVNGWVNGRFLRESGGAAAPEQPVAAPAASGEIECAIAGYASARSCSVSLARRRGSAVSVSITLPDGDLRVLEFAEGQVRPGAGVSAFRFRRSNGNYYINIDNGQERFTIADTLVNGG